MTPDKFKAKQARTMTKAYSNREADKLKAEQTSRLLEVTVRLMPAVIESAMRVIRKHQ